MIDRAELVVFNITRYKRHVAIAIFAIAQAITVYATSWSLLHMLITAAATPLAIIYFAFAYAWIPIPGDPLGLMTPPMMCAWCQKKIKIDGQWVDGYWPIKWLSHGICDDCHRQVVEEEF